MLALGPAAFVVVYAFNAGGYFPGAIAWGVAALAAVGLVLLADGRTRLGGGRLLRYAAVAAALLAAWTLLSALWSGSPWRAVVEFDRVVLYALALSIFAALSVRWSLLPRAIRALAGAIVLVCLAALLARLLPETYPFAADFDGFGLAYPVTYANALGLLATLGLLLGLHLASDEGETPRVQVLAAATVPLLATTLALTASSGATVAGFVGLLVYVAAARSRGLLVALLATVPTAALAVASARGAPAIAGAEATSAAAVAQGSQVAATVALSMANAALIRWLATRASRTRRRAAGGGGSRRAVLAGAVVLAVIAAAGVLLVGGADAPSTRAPGLAAAPYEARLDHWRVALGGFAAAPVLGGGAGTYETLSQRERSLQAAVRDAHSLPLETLAELGLVGGLLLIAMLGMVAGGLIAAARGTQAGPSDAVLAIFVAWVTHAAIDWDWEMPVVTLPVLVLCGVALGARSGRETRQTEGHGEANARRDGGSDALDGAKRGLAHSRAAHTLGVRGRTAQWAAGAALLVLVAAALAIAISERQLVLAAAAARAGDCEAAARSPQFLLVLRPEPYATTAGCELRRARARRGPERRAHAQRAQAAFAAAAQRDPDNLTHRDGLRRAQRVARAGEAR